MGQVSVCLHVIRVASLPFALLQSQQISLLWNCSSLCVRTCLISMSQVWLQQFAWTEDARASAIAQRRRYTASHTMDREPLFVFQTAVKLLYWSELIYGYEEAPVLGVGSQQTETPLETPLDAEWKPMEEVSVEGKATQVRPTIPHRDYREDLQLRVVKDMGCMCHQGNLTVGAGLI